MEKKFNSGLIGKLGIGVLALAGLVKNADAGIVTVRHRGPPITYVSDVNLRNISGATDGWDGYPIDSVYAENPFSPSLEIYTKVVGSPNGKLSTDSRPTDTSGWDFYLAVNDFVSYSTNILRFKVTDTTDLSGRDLVAFDTANPNTTYVLSKDGSYFSINLPDLVNQGEGEYAQWRLDLRPIADANFDMVVNGTDLAILKANFGSSGVQDYNRGDFDGNGVINATDLAILKSNFGYSAPTGSEVPEPMTLGMLGLGGLCLAGYGRKK